MWKLLKNLFKKSKNKCISYPKNHELTKDQVRMISSFFRGKKYVLGLALNTPLGEIARVARLHWMNYELLVDKLNNVTKDKDLYKFYLDQYESKCAELAKSLSDLTTESNDHMDFTDWLTIRCIEFYKEVGFDITKEELLQKYKESKSLSEVNNGIQEE